MMERLRDAILFLSARDGSIARGVAGWMAGGEGEEANIVENGSGILR